jgi:NAD+ kinase
MSAAFKTVALVGRYKSRDVAEPIRVLGRFLVDRGCTVLIEQETATESGVSGFPVVDFSALGAQADLAVILGGDGSMLSAARALAPSGVPLVGVNQGRLGFMTDIALGAMTDAMAKIISGDYATESRTMLAATVSRAGQAILAMTALNDVVVSKGATGRLIELMVRIDGQFLYDLRSDGLIVATPSGSTAYALSAGGPIIQPGVPALALVPICPHTLSNRPIAVAETTTLEIAVKRGADARLHFDGQPQFDLIEGDRVEIRRAEHAAKLVHPPGYSYYAMLREKLRWSESLF